MYEFAVAPAVTQIRRRGVVITEVTPESLAAELELEAGDRILRINGRPVRDYLDFRFQTGGETELIMDVRKQSGEEWELDIERGEGEDFGLGFEQIVPRQCANECLFCFCKGNPDDARPSLFIRDEDIRLSFLYGNYTTLTSITEDEMTRVIDQRLTPQYVSVHATDWDVRAYLLGIDKERADISGKIRRMIDAGIEIHAQVVLCPGINDGEVLKKTVEDLSAFHPMIKSVAIVPLGLTRYNTDTRLTAVSPEFCVRTIDEVAQIQEGYQERLGTNFAFLGDEIYLKAGKKVPTRKHYGDYPQIEDGIGMVTSFQQEFDALVRRLRRRKLKASVPQVEATVMTGSLFAPVLKARIERFNAEFGTKLHVIGLENQYFGGDVSVAGLLTGRDFVGAKEQIRGDLAIIPASSLKSGESIMLDGMRLEDLEKELGLPVHAMDLNGFSALFM
jgi:putative radical SAM enzyme (TIGR03279 family)